MNMIVRRFLSTFILVLILSTPLMAIATTGGPDGGGYTFLDSAEATLFYDYTSIAHIDNSIDIGSDDRAIAVDIGFFFTFYGNSYNTVYISSNGHMDFTYGYGNDSWNELDLPIPTASTTATVGDAASDNGWGMNPLIAPFFDDLSVALSGSDVYAFTSGTAPDRIFIVQWDGMPHYSCPATSEPLNRMTIQAIIYEGSNDIKFQYPDVTSTCPLYSEGASATVGIDYNGSVGLQYSANTASLSDDLAIAFIPGNEASISPSSNALDFGTVEVGDTSRALLRLHNTGDQMLFIAGTTTEPSAPFTLVSDNCTGGTVLAHSYCTVTVEYAPALAGALADSIIFDSNDALTPALTIDLDGTGAATASGANIWLSDPDGTTTDLQADYGSLAIFSTLTKTFTVHNDGDAALDVTSVGPIVGDYSLLADTCTGAQVSAGSSCTFDLSLTPVDPGMHSALFNVVSSDADESPLTFAIDASAYYTSIANITVSDTVDPSDDMKITFTDTLQGKTALANIIIGNNGTDILVITGYDNPSAPSTPFARQSETCLATTLAPGETCMVTISYTPATVDSFSDTFGIISNDTGSSPLTIALEANSVSNPPTAPVLVYPGMAATGIPVDFTFRWEASTDPDGDTVSYRHYYTTEAGYIANGNSFTGVTPTDVASIRVASTVMYASALGAPGIFLLASVLMAGPMSRRRKVMVGLVIIFAMLMLVMACGNGLPGEGDDSGGSGQVTLDVTGLTSGASYYWQVDAVDSNGATASSAVWKFTTE